MQLSALLDPFCQPANLTTWNDRCLMENGEGKLTLSYCVKKGNNWYVLCAIENVISGQFALAIIGAISVFFSRAWGVLCRLSPEPVGNVNVTGAPHSCTCHSHHSWPYSGWKLYLITTPPFGVITGLWPASSDVHSAIRVKIPGEDNVSQWRFKAIRWWVSARGRCSPQH